MVPKTVLSDVSYKFGCISFEFYLALPIDCPHALLRLHERASAHAVSPSTAVKILRQVCVANIPSQTTPTPCVLP
jgi:hypothetical protein